MVIKYYLLILVMVIKPHSSHLMQSLTVDNRLF